MTDQPVSARQRVLFLCSGNYYRSRFAEYLFNFLADRDDLNWEATSRGLSPRFSPHNIGPLSVYTRAALEARDIPLSEPVRMPKHLLAADLDEAELVIALKEAEHRPLMQQHFAAWVDQVEYWQVHDLDFAPAEAALPEIERLVEELVTRLKQQRRLKTM